MTLNDQQLAENINTLSNLYAIQNILISIGQDLKLIINGTQGKLLTVNNANLFQLASLYYKDATKWTAIAKVNGMIDTQTPFGQTVTLLIPNNPEDSGGIL